MTPLMLYTYNMEIFAVCLSVLFICVYGLTKTLNKLFQSVYCTACQKRLDEITARTKE